MEQWFYLLRSSIDDLDTTTQELVYRSFYQFVYRDTYFMLRDHSITEDIIQESFLKAVSQGPKLRSDANIPGWIKQVTRNTAIDWLRKMKRDRQMLNGSYVSISETVLDEISVAKEVEIKMRDATLYQALNELKPDYRTLLLLFYMEGKSYKEICKELHMTESVFTQRLARARKKLLQHFSGKWVDRDD
ncbi:RNA polymerase sigma factor [Paenibacillus periandrae]|uniref:RNA polymerase sigma factor n=1 Tax=Paenibacillus periandrae TaxID=1761741 RepID=UPI001F0980C1|nr:sigma-70 family RNA polymerase sigma factor [Paenibacillus periandrae]